MDKTITDYPALRLFAEVLSVPSPSGREGGGARPARKAGGLYRRRWMPDAAGHAAATGWPSGRLEQRCPVALRPAPDTRSVPVARVGCFGHVRENSHGYEVARLSCFDNVHKTLVRFVTHWEG